MANDVRVRASVVDNVSTPLGRLVDKFKVFGDSASQASFRGNLGAMALSKGLSLAAEGISTVVSHAFAAADAFLEDERSITRLNTAIVANVKAWDGNIASVEDVLKERMKLGYSDDEQRDSLARLVAATHNVTDALKIQRIAMDLSRLRGIDLGDATDLLTKVYNGNVGILKRYGIAVRDGASATEALRAVQAQAAGQADRYAETTGGKLLAAQVKAKEAEEKFGAVVAKLEAVVLPPLADALSFVADAFGTVGDVVGKVGEAFHGFTNFVADAAEVLNPFDDDLRAKARDYAAYATSITTEQDRLNNAIYDSLEERRAKTSALSLETAGAQTDAFAGERPKVVAEVRKTWSDIAHELRSGYDDVFRAADDLATAIKNPIDRATRISKLQGVLYGKDLAAGLRSTDPILQAESKALAEQVIAEIKSLGGDAYKWGYKTGDAYIDGLVLGIGSSEQINRLRQRVTRIRRILEAGSPPGPESPLHKIDVWGERTGEAYIGGLAKGLGGDVKAPLSRLAAGIGGAPTVGGAAAPGGGPTFNLYPSGPATPGSMEAFAREVGPYIATYLSRRRLIAA